MFGYNHNNNDNKNKIGASIDFWLSFFFSLFFTIMEHSFFPIFWWFDVCLFFGSGGVLVREKLNEYFGCCCWYFILFLMFRFFFFWISWLHFFLFPPSLHIYRATPNWCYDHHHHGSLSYMRPTVSHSFIQSGNSMTMHAMTI